MNVSGFCRSISLAPAANTGICVLQAKERNTCKVDFISSTDWNLPNPLSPTALADTIFDFCVREPIPSCFSMDRKVGKIQKADCPTVVNVRRR
jgi:hypothetical protein